MPDRKVTLRSTRHGRDVRWLGASIAADGDLVIEGQDLGPAVEEIFGDGLTEYEWTRTIAAADVPDLLEALGGLGAGEADILDVIARRFSGPDAFKLDQALAASGVAVEAWSRIGD